MGAVFKYCYTTCGWEEWTVTVCSGCIYAKYAGEVLAILMRLSRLAWKML